MGRGREASDGDHAAGAGEMTAPSGRRVLFVGGGRIALLSLWAVGQILIIRVLGPREFGLFALGVAMIKLLSSLVGDALDLAVLRSVPVQLRTDRIGALRVLWAAFQVRLLAGAIALALAVAFARPIAHWYFNSPDRAWLVLLAAGGVLGELLLRSVSGYFQASESFRQFMLLEACLQVSRVGIVLGLLGWGALTAESALGVYVGVPFAVFALGFYLLPPGVARVRGAGFRELGHVVQYAKWLVLAFVFAAVHERVEVVLLGLFQGPAEVGVYSAALTLAAIPDFIANSFATVLHPRIVPSYVKGEFSEFNRAYLRYALPAGATALVGALFLGPLVIPAVLSAKYVAAIPVFQVLVVGTLLQAVVTLLPAGLVSMVAPRRLVGMSAGALLASTAAGLALVPTFGPLGAACVFVTVRIGMCGWVTLLARRTLRENPHGPAARSGTVSEPGP